MPRTRFNSPRLVRVLADLAAPDAPESKQSFGERLGQWLDFNAALSLFSALNAGAAGASERRAAAPSAEGAAARQAFARVRGALADAIATLGMPDAIEDGADFAPCHRCYLARQRDMNAGIGPLRASVRAALSRQSPALRRLAVLDAVMEQALAVRERDLLATVPEFLAKRFDDLYKAHLARLDQAQTADDPERWLQPGGWLAAFRGEMQAVLLAELDLRLQPVAGLIAALDEEGTSSNE